jgi:predicted proteasome-type protease
MRKKYQRHKEYQQGSKILVVCDTLKDEIEKRVLQQAKKEIISIKQDDIWKIEIIFESVHIFYKTDDGCKANDKG